MKNYFTGVKRSSFLVQKSGWCNLTPDPFEDFLLMVLRTERFSMSYKNWTFTIFKHKGPCHKQHFCSQYCDKKISYFLPIQGMLCFNKNLPWLVIETHGSKLSNISISFYRNIVYKNVWCDMGLIERCPTSSPIATCGNKHFECGDSHNFVYDKKRL